ncbi:MAG: DNA polymerase III subunit beta [candidate division WOR-3 bacterium]|nr:DNA polymerase III subunit beta [candidate division WOR-3 bacterium]MCR4423042.1 DNA polymerase III subunit beta [candidate division WOR-3 bacterium]MDH7518381.1 DNA polymerase III subunit beta [bacterium]
MHCELDRDVLADVLSSIVQVIPAKTTFPIYQNILLEVTDGELAITGSDGDTALKKRVRLEGKTSAGTALVRGRELNTLVQESSGSTVVLDEDGKMLMVNCGRMKASFVQFPSEDFPSFPQLPEGDVLEFPVATLFEMFDRCGFATSKEENRPILTGINWEISKNESRMVSTDSYRLALITRKVKSSVKAKLLVPPKVFGLLPQDADKVKVHFDHKMIGLVTENMVIVTRMIEGPYPDYERVIPKENFYRVLVNRDGLLAAVRRAVIISQAIGKPISLEFQNNSITVRAENPELGKSEELLDCQYEGELLRIGFNGNLLLEIIRHITTEDVQIEFSSAMAPVFLKPTGQKSGDEDLFILMPIRLD